jgi:hypothetical protein
MSVLNCLPLALGCAIAFAADLSSATNGSADDRGTMTSKRQHVSSVEELLAATRDRSVGEIAVSGDLAALPTVKLLPGQQLTSLNFHGQELT